MSFLHLSTGSLAHSSCANCSSSPRFEGFLLPTAVFRSPTTGVQWDLDLDSLLATSEQSSVLSWINPGCFLKCVWGHCPAARPMTFDGDPAFWHWVEHCAPKCLGNLLISWCHAHIQGTQSQRQHSNPKHHWTSSMFDCRECVLFFEGFILFSVNMQMMCFPKKL